jgi:hypothetical protein
MSAGVTPLAKTARGAPLAALCVVARKNKSKRLLQIVQMLWFVMAFSATSAPARVLWFWMWIWIRWW